MDRRNFVKQSAIAAAGLAILPSGSLFAQNKKVRLAFIGVGYRGQNHLDNALRRSDVDVVAICDINDRMLEMSKKVFARNNKTVPKIFTGDPYAWKKCWK